MTRLVCSARDFARVAVVVGAVLGFALILLAIGGYDLASCASAFWHGTFGNRYGLASILTGACPLILTGLAVALAFRAGALNIGAEGQLLVGGLAAVALATSVDLPPWALAPMLFVGGVAGGCLWAGIAGALRVWRRVPEVLSTILLNFVAIEFVRYAVTGPLEGVRGTAQTAEIPHTLRLWMLDPSTDLHAGIFLALLAAPMTHLLIHRTTAGFELRAVGDNPVAAMYAGMSPARAAFVAMLISGGLAGVAGCVELLGRVGSLSQGFTTVGYGYTAIAVAMLARLSPLGVVASALFFSALASGTREMTFEPNYVPDKLVEVIRGLVVLLAVGYGVAEARFSKRST
ncbi:ABC transporter permease [Candidatus Poribacteria bacterium]|nr:ABC transporter permease [Candidatus Poribacteria bacterium]